MRTGRHSRRLGTLSVLGAGILLLVCTPAGAASAASNLVTVRPGDDVNAVIARAEAGDTVLLSPGSYRGPVRVTKAITLTAQQATVTASSGPAIEVVAGGATVDSLAVTCNGSTGSTGIHVTAQHVSVVGTSVLQCARGVELDGATDAYLQGDALLGSRAHGLAAGVFASGADGLTVFGNTFQDDDTGIVVEHTSAPALDSNTFSGLGTAVALRSVGDAVVSGTQVAASTGPAVLVTGSRGAEVTGFNLSGDGGGSGPAIQLSSAEGPSSVVSVENSDLAHFAVGLRVDADSILDPVTVMGTSFDRVTDTGIVVAPGSGSTVAATIGDYFGGCGPRAPDHHYDGGGVLVHDPSHAVSFLRDRCAPAKASATPATHTPAASVATASAGGGDDGLWREVGSAIVTAGVALLLVGCAIGVLYAMRRGRDVH